MAVVDSAHATGSLMDEAASLLARGDYSTAIEHAEAALTDSATRTDAVYILSAVAFRSDQLATAIRLLEPVLNENAARSDVPELLAVLNCLAGRAGTALYYAKLTTIIQPEGRTRALFGTDFPSISDAFQAPPTKPLLAKGKTRMAEGLLDDGIAMLEQHLDLFPNDVEGLDAYSDALAQAGRPQEAIGVLRSVLTLAGPSATLYCRLGCCLTETGEFEQARACHAEALARAPKSLALHAEMLLDLDRHGESALTLRTAVLAAQAQAQAATAPKTVRKAPAAINKPNICIGYLCSALPTDIRDMVARVVLAHDRATVTTVGFGDGELSQADNAGFRGAFDRWVNVAPLDEMTLAVIARGENVDILVDADGLMAPARPHLFARNAAPVQLNWFHIPDGVQPSGAHGTLSGADAPMGSLLLHPAEAALRERPPGPVAFAADVAMSQLNAEVARVWSAILHALPDTTLALYDRALHEPQNTARLIDLFGNFGVAHRIDVIAAQSPTDFFAECDIALAPFPSARFDTYGQALSLGVPVVTLDGGPARLLANTIRRSGFAGTRMVAANGADYVALARDWAADSAARRQARLDAATIVATSPAFSPASFAAGLEQYVRRHLEKEAAA